MSTPAKRPYSRARGGSIQPIDRTYTGVGHRARASVPPASRRPPCPRSSLPPTGRARSSAAEARPCRRGRSLRRRPRGGRRTGAGRVPGRRTARSRSPATPTQAASDIWTMSPNGRDLVNLTPDSPADDEFAELARGRAQDRVRRATRTTPGQPHPRGSKARLRDLRDERRRVGRAADHVQRARRRGPRLVARRQANRLPTRPRPRPRPGQTTTSSRCGPPAPTSATSRTHPALEDGAPNWSPDGRRIAFDSDRDGGTDEDAEIYTMNPDGSRLRRLTDNDDVRRSAELVAERPEDLLPELSRRRNSRSTRCAPTAATRSG